MFVWSNSNSDWLVGAIGVLEYTSYSTNILLCLQSLKTVYTIPWMNVFEKNKWLDLYGIDDFSASAIVTELNEISEFDWILVLNYRTITS